MALSASPPRGPRGTLDQTGREATSPAQPAFDAGHLTGVTVVIIAEQVQEAVKCQHPQLLTERMPGFTRLPGSHTGRDDDIAEVGRP